MTIGVLTVDLNMEGAFSLKDKRAVINRIRDRVRNKFNVSIAEVDGNELWNYGCLGIAVVSNDKTYANQVLSKVVELMESIRDCEIEDITMEFI